jgi:HlyD family secretion protein
MILKLYILSCITFITVGCLSRTEKIRPVIQNITESVYGSGIVKSKDQYQVYSTANGIITDILVKEGDTLKKGDALMYLQNEAALLHVKNAELAKHQADLKKNQSKLREALMAVDLAFTKRINDSILLERQRNLWSQHIGTKVELEQRSLAAEISKTNYIQAQLDYRELHRQLKFAFNQSVNNLKITSTQAEDYIIRAKRSGKVYKILKEPGEYVTTASPLAIVGDRQDFITELKIDEYDITRIQPGQAVFVTMDSHKGEVFEGRITDIEPLMNEDSRSFTVKAVFITSPRVLYPNLTVEANIVIRTSDNVLTIPRHFVAKDSTVILSTGERRKVKLGIMDYTWAEVLSGLTAEDILMKP